MNQQIEAAIDKRERLWTWLTVNRSCLQDIGLGLALYQMSLIETDKYYNRPTDHNLELVVVVSNAIDMWAN